MRAWAIVFLGLAGCGGSDDSNQGKTGQEAGLDAPVCEEDALVTGCVPPLPPTGELGDECSPSFPCTELEAWAKEQNIGAPQCRQLLAGVGTVCTFQCDSTDPALCASLGGICSEAPFGATGATYCQLP